MTWGGSGTKWKAYPAKDDARYKLMTLDDEFIHRFLIHVCPTGSTASVTTAFAPGCQPQLWPVRSIVLDSS